MRLSQTSRNLWTTVPIQVDLAFDSCASIRKISLVLFFVFLWERNSFDTRRHTKCGKPFDITKWWGAIIVWTTIWIKNFRGSIVQLSFAANNVKRFEEWSHLRITKLGRKVMKRSTILFALCHLFNEFRDVAWRRRDFSTEGNAVKLKRKTRSQWSVMILSRTYWRLHRNSPFMCSWIGQSLHQLNKVAEKNSIGSLLYG